MDHSKGPPHHLQILSSISPHLRTTVVFYLDDVNVVFVCKKMSDAKCLNRRICVYTTYNIAWYHTSKTHIRA